MRALVVLLWTVSRRELASRPVRALLVAGTIAVGVAMLTAMRVATDSIVAGFAADLDRLAGKADLQVTFGTGEAGFPEDLLDRIAVQPFVEQAAALVRGTLTFEEGERETVELFGVDVLKREVLDLYDVKVLEREPDDFTILNDPRGIFLTETIAAERGLGLGDIVRMSGVDGAADYRVRGIVATQGLAEFLGGRMVSMYLPAAQPPAGRQGDLEASMIDQIDVRLRPGTDLALAQRALDELVGEGYLVATPMQRRLAARHTVDGLRSTLVAMSTLVLLAAVFIVYASTTTLVVDRLPAMATLVSVGASPGLLLRAVVAEAALLALVGSTVGVGLGLALASFVGEDVAAGMGLNYSLTFHVEKLAFSPLVVFVLHPLGGVLTAAFSAMAPARRLRHAEPLVLQRDADSLRSRPTLSLAGSIGAAVVVSGAGVGLLAGGLHMGRTGWISAGGLVLIAGAVLATLPVLRLAWTALLPLLTSLHGIAGRLAGENLLRSLDRSLVTACAITLSVAVAVGAASLVRSFRASVADWYGFSGDVLVSSHAVTGGWLAQPLSPDFEEPLRALEGVAGLETLRVIQGQPYRGERLAVAALSDGLVRDAVRLGETLGGASDAQASRLVAAGEAVAVSRNFVTHFGLQDAAGSPFLEVATVTGDLRLPIVAIVPDYVSDKGSLIVARDLARTHWLDDLVNYYAIDLAPGTDDAALRRRVDQFVPGSDAVSVTRTSTMIARVDALIGRAFADIDTIKLLVLFLTAIGIADLVVSNVLSRRRELAVMRLVGMTDGQLVRTARLEGLCISLGAALCGAAVGTLCAWIWVTYNYPVLVGYVLDLRISWASIGLCIAVAILAAHVAGTIGARYALGRPDLMTLRNE